ncbi:MAG: NADPH:quinone reductase [Dissulfurispiraceae bacterium]|jgi:NADPH:quinone reductase
MKAIRVHQFGPPEIMKLEEAADPRPDRGEVVVKLFAVGVNPVDTYIRSGLYTTRPDLPYTPGMDGAGLIESVGEKITKVAVGDRVYIWGSITGSYAEKTKCLESQVHPLATHLSFEQGAGVGVPYSTAYHALFHRARAVPGNFILVHGASGGVGTAAVQLARASGMKVIATAGTAEGRKSAIEQGALYAVDHRDPLHLKETLAITGGRGVDVILEMLANVNLGSDLPVLAENGRVVVIGSRGKVDIDPRDLMSRNGSILGMAVLMAPEQEREAIYSALGAGLDNRTLTPIVGKIMPLANASMAHHEVMEASAHGKIVLKP